MKLSLLTLSVALAVTAAAASGQSSSDDERRAAITAMRAINTAENAVKQTTGKYLELGALLEHRAMGGVKANFAANGQFFFHQGAQVRLVLAADGSGYQVMVVPVSTCGTAVFSDEGGLIYTGKVLDC